MQGWIKLYRKLIKSWIWTNPYMLKLWIYCLLRAAHSPQDVNFNGKIVHLRSGELVTGRDALEADYNSGSEKKHKKNGQTLFRWLEKFEEQGMVNIKKTTKYSVISMIGWPAYQSDEQHLIGGSSQKAIGGQEETEKFEHQNNDETASATRHSENTPKSFEQHLNIKRTSTEHQLNTYKNETRMNKNDKELGSSSVENPFDFFQQNFGMMNPYQMQEITQWQTDHSDEWIVEAMKSALDQQRRNWGYVKGIMRRWQDSNINTVEDIKADKTSFQNKQQSYNGQSARPIKPKDPSHNLPY